MAALLALLTTLAQHPANVTHVAERLTAASGRYIDAAFLELESAPLEASHLKLSARKKLMHDLERKLMPLADDLTHEQLLGACGWVSAVWPCWLCSAPLARACGRPM